VLNHIIWLAYGSQINHKDWIFTGPGWGDQTSVP